MNGYEVKKVMEQIHISSKMQEELIMNIQNRMETGSKNARVWNWKRMAAAAAALALTAGVISFPVRAFVASVVTERMENVPEEERKELNDIVQSQHALADGFSREYSDSEKERNKALWQAYENGTFPEKVIAQADNAEAAPEGALCYIRSTGVFNLPAQEMTDEELLEIIDFQHKMEYAVAHSGAVTEEEKAACREKEARLKKIVQDANGISEEEAIEIAEKQFKTDLGDAADEMELMTDRSGSGADLMDLADFAEAMDLESKAGVVYDVGFGNPKTHCTYGYFIDAVDGSVLHTWKSDNAE